MYIFETIEIEQIIFSYLDYCIDFNVLKQINKNYKTRINNHNIYNALYNFDQSGMNCFKYKSEIYRVNCMFIEACHEACYEACYGADIFVVKYLFYKYPSIDIHFMNEKSFSQSCKSGRLDIAKWLWSLDGKIDLHISDDHIFRDCCENGQLDVAYWLWNLNGKINIPIPIDELLMRWLYQLDNKIEPNTISRGLVGLNSRNNRLINACWYWKIAGTFELDVSKETIRSKILKWLGSVSEKNRDIKYIEGKYFNKEMMILIREPGSINLRVKLINGFGC